MKKILLFLLFLLPILSFTQLPTSNGDIYHRDGYSFSYNEKHEQANWVYYKITTSDLVCDQTAKRKNYFKEDRLVKTGSSKKSDYYKSGLDRGHLKPSASERCDQEQMNETFLMSNMSPQYPSLNRFIWKNLEANVRDTVLKSDSVIVVTGPILTDSLKTIGENEVSVPEYFYKVIKVYKNEKMSEWCYLIPNLKDKNSYKELNKYLVDKDYICELTNISDF